MLHAVLYGLSVLFVRSETLRGFDTSTLRVFSSLDSFGDLKSCLASSETDTPVTSFLVA